jgi:hypothetical protein
LALAEQLDVGLQLEGKDTKRESPEQFRERKTRREATLIEDKIATARERIEARLKVRAMLDEYPLDADERQQIEMEVLTDISNGTNGQDSVTSLVK